MKTNTNTNTNTNNEDKLIKELNEIKAIPTLTYNKNGDSINLKLTLNSSLLKIIRKMIIDEEVLIKSDNPYFNFGNCGVKESEKRYKVKKIFYSCLSNSHYYREVIFIKSFIDNGYFNFKFENIQNYYSFIDCFRINLNSLLKTFFTLSMKSEISFGLKYEDNNKNEN